MASVQDKINVLKSMQQGATGEEVRQKAEQRNRAIVRTSLVGVAANVLLAAFKAVVGLMTNSIAIVLDAVNNISDAASSLITIIGTKLAGREADRKHPFGYGRIEYMSAMIISVIVLYAGITSFTESVKKIVRPDQPDYTAVSLVIVAVGVVVKILLGRYVKSVGQREHSDSLVNSGEDARLDSVISASTLVAAVLYLSVGVSLEAWLGAVISVIIIKSGVEMLRDTISELLGERAEASLSRQIRKTVAETPGVQGAYDLILNNYGPDAWSGSVHIEVPDTCRASEIDLLIRQITYAVYVKYNVILTAVSIYSVNTTDPETIKIRDHIRQIAMANPYVIQMHGFYLEKERKMIRFDVVISFDTKDRHQAWEDVVQAVKKAYPDYQLLVTMDTDFSET